MFLSSKFSSCLSFMIIRKKASSSGFRYQGENFVLVICYTTQEQFAPFFYFYSFHKEQAKKRKSTAKQAHKIVLPSNSYTHNKQKFSCSSYLSLQSAEYFSFVAFQSLRLTKSSLLSSIVSSGFMNLSLAHAMASSRAALTSNPKFCSSVFTLSVISNTTFFWTFLTL